MKSSLKETKKFLQIVKNESEISKVTNLQNICKRYNVDCLVGTMLNKLDIVQKQNGSYKWVGSKPTKKMAKLIRNTANQYKNYAE